MLTAIPGETTEMPRFYLIVGLTALSFFSWAQYRGIGLFDDTSQSGQPTRLSSSHGTYHK
jgi:hypothetical protein